MAEFKTSQHISDPSTSVVEQQANFISEGNYIFLSLLFILTYLNASQLYTIIVGIQLFKINNPDNVVDGISNGVGNMVCSLFRFNYLIKWFDWTYFK